MKKAVINVTNFCNFDCVNCCDRYHNKERYDLDFKQIKKIITENLLDFDIDITGGEPLLYKHIFKLLNFLKDLKKKGIYKGTFTLFTNGFYLRENINKIHKSIPIVIGVHPEQFEKVDVEFFKYEKRNISYCYVIKEKYIDNGEILKHKELLDRLYPPKWAEFDHLDKNNPKFKKYNIHKAFRGFFEYMVSIQANGEILACKKIIGTIFDEVFPMNRCKTPCGKNQKCPWKDIPEGECALI